MNNLDISLRRIPEVSFCDSFIGDQKSGTDRFLIFPTFNLFYRHCMYNYVNCCRFWTVQCKKIRSFKWMVSKLIWVSLFDNHYSGYWYCWSDVHSRFMLRFARHPKVLDSNKTKHQSKRFLYNSVFDLKSFLKLSLTVNWNLSQSNLFEIGFFYSWYATRRHPQRSTYK